MLGQMQASMLRQPMRAASHLAKKKYVHYKVMYFPSLFSAKCHFTWSNKREFDMSSFIKVQP